MKGMSSLIGIFCLPLFFWGCSQEPSADKAAKNVNLQDLNEVVGAREKPQSGQVSSTGRVNLGGISVSIPKGWKKVAPSSSMRVAEYHMSGARPQDKDAILAIFAGKMGPIEANINRWIGQFTQPDGSATANKVKRWEKNLAGMRAVLVDIPGTYAPNMGMRQTTAPASSPNYRMVGAILDYGPKFFYFKLTGPKDTVSLWTTSFEEFINSIQKN